MDSEVSKVEVTDIKKKRDVTL